MPAMIFCLHATSNFGPAVSVGYSKIGHRQLLLQQLKMILHMHPAKLCKFRTYTECMSKEGVSLSVWLVEQVV